MPDEIARDLTAEAIAAGQTHEFSVDIDAGMVARFAALSGDRNPLHVDADYARRSGYVSAVAHGALQIALVSQAVGMWAIGRRCLIGRITTRFSDPLCYPAAVRVRSSVVRWSAAYAAGAVEVRVVDMAGTIVYSTSSVDVSFHGRDPTTVIETIPADLNAKGAGQSDSAQRPIVLITGATGGVLAPLLPLLSRRFRVIAMGRDEAKLTALTQTNGTPQPWQALCADLAGPVEQFEAPLHALLEGSPLWGIVHGAGHLPSRESVASWQCADFQNDLVLNGHAPIRLANFMQSHAGAGGGRIVLIGSNFAGHNRPERSLARYGVAKSVQAVVMKGLVDELARLKVTINMVSPEFMHAGMNAGVPERFARLKAAENPTGRLCRPDDCSAAILYLLDESAGFCTGQELVLGGGK
jgi:NAD(P)-dependent dehydrogenase (short-subunit alcohol dehydrogenase family)/acyl dehydratase